MRGRKRGGRCRWWSAKAGQLSRNRTKCTRPRWMKAKLKQTSAGQWSWTAALNGRLPKGRYTLALQGTDGVGNVAAENRVLRIR